VQGAVNRLLGRPQLGRHLGELALLVVDNQTLCLLEPGGGCEEGSVRRKLAESLSSNAPYAAAFPRVRTDPYRVALRFECPCSHFLPLARPSNPPLSRLLAAHLFYYLTSDRKGSRRVARGPSMC
jgi:hypothetical protein